MGGVSDDKKSEVPEPIAKVFAKLPKLPYEKRGIKIHYELVKATLEILNNADNKILPQNSRNASAEETPDGLDKRIKMKLGSDLRTANIISDELGEVGVVEVTKIKNPETGRMIKATRILDEFAW